METKVNQQKKGFTIKIEKVLGIIILLPPIFSVLLFFLGIFNFKVEQYEVKNKELSIENLSPAWKGEVQYFEYSSGDIVESRIGGGGGGYTSATPIYLGLMALAGAMLLKKNQ